MESKYNALLHKYEGSSWRLLCNANTYFHTCDSLDFSLLNIHYLSSFWADPYSKTQKRSIHRVMQTWVWIPLITFLSYPNTSRLQAYEALIGYLGYKMREEGREFGSGEGVWVAGGRWVLQDLYFEKYSVDNRQDGRKRDIGWNREFIAEF